MLECVGPCPAPPEWLVSGVVVAVVVGLLAFTVLMFRSEFDDE